MSQSQPNEFSSAPAEPYVVGEPTVGVVPHTETPDHDLTCRIDVSFLIGGVTLGFTYDGPWDSSIGEQLEIFLLHVGV